MSMLKIAALAAGVAIAVAYLAASLYITVAIIKLITNM
ncbi:hypothetical protein BvCmsKSP022_00800 [Escherichia coli]|nr:hypothetical protein BvCmsKSP022_00800 [Escherichia coli]